MHRSHGIPLLGLVQFEHQKKPRTKNQKTFLCQKSEFLNCNSDKDCKATPTDFCNNDLFHLLFYRGVQVHREPLVRVARKAIQYVRNMVFYFDFEEHEKSCNIRRKALNLE